MVGRAGTAGGAGADLELPDAGAGRHVLVPSQPRAESALTVSGARALAGRHVLVVGINYAPEPTGVAPYTTGMARHLAALAARVTVLTGIPHYPAWNVPPGYRNRLRRKEFDSLDGAPPGVDPGVHVVRHRHHVPGRQGALRRGLYEGSFLANVSRTRLDRAPDLVIGVTPSLGGAVAAARFAERHDVPLLLVVQDLMASAAGQSGIAGGGRVAGLTAKAEGWALGRATRVAVVSESFRAPLRLYGVPPERIDVLPNWLHIDPVDVDLPTARRRLGWPERSFLAVHTGNMGLKQDLGNVVEAARALRQNAGVEVVLVGDGSQRAALGRLAGDVPNLRFVDPVGDADYPLVLAAADVLLVNERPGVRDMSLPSKLTSYLGAGRPIVAAVEPQGATARELHRTRGAALTVPPGKPWALAAAVASLVGEEQRSAAMGAAGRVYAEGSLGRAAAMARLDAVIARTLA